MTPYPIRIGPSSREPAIYVSCQCFGGVRSFHSCPWFQRMKLYTFKPLLNGYIGESVYDTVTRIMKGDKS